MNYLLVGLGGFVGSILRYLVSLIPLKQESGFPVKTLAVNLIGAFLIGFIVALALKHKMVHPNLLLFLKVGVCGGFTTFSSLALEASDLLKAGATGPALLYLVLSLVLGIAAVILGQAVVK